MAERKRLSEESLGELLWCLIDWDALELCTGTEKGEVLIPYVMNDAVESYLRLTGCAVHGELNGEPEDGISLEMVQSGDTKGLILRQQSGNMVSLWYDEAYQVVNCYQYHLIGHGWRQEKGEEYIRRLVNLICVLHDKMTYLGLEYVSETERLLASLAEFPPVLYFTPINESILDWYPKSAAGIEAMRKLAVQAEDGSFLEELSGYENLFRKGKVRQKQTQRMAGSLLRKEHAGLWRLMDEKLCQASLAHEPRDYGSDMAARVAEVRQRLTDDCRANGFQGEYPYLFWKNPDGNTEKELIFVEEQPFSVMESPDFEYRIYSMTVDGGHVAACRWSEEAVIPDWKTN